MQLSYRFVHQNPSWQSLRITTGTLLTAKSLTNPSQSSTAVNMQEHQFLHKFETEPPKVRLVKVIRSTGETILLPPIMVFASLATLGDVTWCFQRLFQLSCLHCWRIHKTTSLELFDGQIYVYICFVCSFFYVFQVHNTRQPIFMNLLQVYIIFVILLHYY